MQYKSEHNIQPRQTNRSPYKLALGAALGVLVSVPASALAGTINYTLKTDIRELSTGMVDGVEYLTIEIDQKVGPMACRSNVLKVVTEEPLTEKIEAVALSALVQQDQVMITIPLQRSDCVDGNPAILDMFLLHNS